MGSRQHKVIYMETEAVLSSFLSEIKIKFLLHLLQVGEGQFIVLSFCGISLQ